MRGSHRLAFGTLALALILVACSSAGGSEGGAASPQGDAMEVASATFEEANVEMFGEPIPLTNDEEETYYLGSTNYPDFTSTAIVQPMINIDTRIAYVLETASEADAIATMEQLQKDVDPTKLVCVAFSMADVRQERRGSVVFMVIDSDHAERDALASAFLAIP